jgi:hypothetical protein
MPTPQWTVIDPNSGQYASAWITQDAGTILRLSLLRLHIQEVSNEIQSGNFTTEKKSHDKELLQQYLETLLTAELREEKRTALATGKRSAFTRAKAILPLNGLGPYKGVPFP